MCGSSVQNPAERPMLKQNDQDSSQPVFTYLVVMSWNGISGYELKVQFGFNSQREAPVIVCQKEEGEVKILDCEQFQ